ncbi:hypothetical protein PP16_gp35 [Pectobacterium phage PP16]|uniref:Uncharacterized protein n=1 Tax=Pectobacterium phage PP16 TaxID=1873958 RepID=A0A3G3C9R2_9CAUD|nr:hypothetical protein PP16_gp35 [Pectobacterium phage PP16]AYP73783.1 hypothetical protein PP16_gp35 [Pectobacterium phage PP16]
MLSDYTGTLRAVYVIKHRVTGEVRWVELGARYNQREWELLGLVEPPQEVQYAHPV